MGDYKGSLACKLLNLFNALLNQNSEEGLHLSADKQSSVQNCKAFLAQARTPGLSPCRMHSSERPGTIRPR